MLLLGLAVLAVLLPLVESEQNGVRRLWWLFPAAVVIGGGFVVWERHTVRRARQPLMDVRLFTSTPGYASGAALGAAYFCGFAGTWLAFAIFFQQGLGYSPLRSGLSVTPFAAGSAVSAALAGRLVARVGRKLTVTGLGLVIVGLGAVAVLVPLVPPADLGPALIAPLLAAGIGGGMVISPNTTLTLECVPASMAGVAGGAPQTGQRIGTAIGTVVLAGVLRAVVTSSHGDYPSGLTAAMLCAEGFLLVAFALALWELRA